MVLCFDGFANAAMFMGCTDQMPSQKSDQACDAGRKQLVQLKTESP